MFQRWHTWLKTAENKWHSKKNHHTEWTIYHVSVLETWIHEQGRCLTNKEFLFSFICDGHFCFELQLCVACLTESYEAISDSFIESVEAEKKTML